MVILNSINQMQNEMQEWRRDLHKIPEIGLEEYKTSAYIKNKLKSWNIEFRDGYSNTGIVAWIKGNKGDGKKSIGIRADFDALPMPEKNKGHVKYPLVGGLSSGDTSGPTIPQHQQNDVYNTATLRGFFTGTTDNTAAGQGSYTYFSANTGGSYTLSSDWLFCRRVAWWFVL